MKLIQMPQKLMVSMVKLNTVHFLKKNMFSNYLLVVFENKIS